jgi:hypothetical protein
LTVTAYGRPSGGYYHPARRPHHVTARSRVMIIDQPESLRGPGSSSRAPSIRVSSAALAPAGRQAKAGRHGPPSPAAGSAGYPPPARLGVPPCPINIVSSSIQSESLSIAGTPAATGEQTAVRVSVKAPVRVSAKAYPPLRRLQPAACTLASWSACTLTQPHRCNVRRCCMGSCLVPAH